jgi:PAS domain S-box-containing protein
MSNILVVEDCRVQADFLRYILEKADFRVEVAADGQQGLERFLAGDFDLVLSDILMPGLSGYELCRRIKDSPAGKQTPVILLTSLNDPVAIIQGIECGADNYLPKPYQPDILLGRIRHALASRMPKPDPKLKVGVEATFLGKTFTISSGKEQILDLLISTCEDIVRANQDLQASKDELAAAKARIEDYARRLEGQARSSEDRYRRLMEQANDAIFVLSTSGAVLEANRRAEELLGQPGTDLVGRPFECFLPAEEREAERAQLQRLLAEGSVRGDDLHFVGADGRSVDVSYSASLADVGGDPVVLAIVHDDTERKRLQEQFHQAQKMEAVGRLAGGVAHDFNNLLTVITGFGELLLHQLGGDSPLRESVSQITKASDKAAALTRQLLAFSRKAIIEPKVLDLKGLVADMERLLRRIIGEDIELATVMDQDLGRVRADPSQIEQVILNLAVNARDAMPQGGKLTIEVRNVELDGSYARTHPDARVGPHVLLAVADTGVGMDRATQARIWEPFFTTKGEAGTGLGLATVYGVVRQSGGHVAVSSEPGQGATFMVYLPLVQDEVSTSKSPANPTVLPAGMETILLVEDEEGVRCLARQVLAGCGYRVLEAGNGQEALRVSTRYPERIDLLVADMVMPRLGGRELAERLRERYPGIRVLFLSGYTDDAVIRHGVLAAEVQLLHKPFTPTALARKVRDVLDR